METCIGSDIRMIRVQALQGERSLTIVLPKVFASGLGIRKGDYVKVIQEEEKIVIEKIQERTKKNDSS
jgi:AbrB family looped-hinge helix DNA binding protein